MITDKDYFNPLGVSPLDEALHTDTPDATGFVDFNRPRYPWVTSAYDTMAANTWFPAEIDTSTEKKSFSLLSDSEKENYTTTFAHLSFLDAAQENYILDFRQMANNSLTKSMLTLQAYQESNHSFSYAHLLDVVGNSSEVFDLYKTDTLLAEKNEAVARQFAQHINGRGAEDMLLSAVASINLEGLFFLTNFSIVHVMGDKMPGSRDMINLISKDELNTHAPIFANIFKTLQQENKFSARAIDKVQAMMVEAVEIEKRYSYGLLQRAPMLGVTQEEITDTIHNFANTRLQAIGIEHLFPVTSQTKLEKMVYQGAQGLNDVKTNFFEGNVKNYAKNSLDMSF